MAMNSPSAISRLISWRTSVRLRAGPNPLDTCLSSKNAIVRFSSPSARTQTGRLGHDAMDVVFDGAHQAVEDESDEANHDNAENNPLVNLRVVTVVKKEA